MEIKRIGIMVWLIVICTTHVHPQSIVKPSFALTSHETLEILKVEMTPETTLIYFAVENKRSEGGSFCADKNIFIIYPDGRRLNLVKAHNIPVCPETFNFRSIGEKLQFTLEFPALQTGTKWIDIVEDCAGNCFWFYGVTLDIELNSRLDEAFSLASEGLAAGNVFLFKNILDDIDSQDLGIEGLLYINIINATVEDADNVSTIVWYKRLVASHAPRLDQYIKYLNDKGIKY